MRKGLTRTIASLLWLCLAATVWASGTQEQTQPSGERPDLRVAVYPLPGSVQPSRGSANARVSMTIFDMLVSRAFWETEAGDGGRLVPSVAESWEQVSPTVWEIKVREGVLFHDGAEVTAEDVAYSFGEERMWGESSLVPNGAANFPTIKSIEAVDRYTVRLETHQPDPAILQRFTTNLGYVVPEKQYSELGWDGFGLAPVGTGPYKFIEFKPDEMIRLESFDEYWDGLPPAKTVTWFEIPEAAGRLTALFNGEVDIIGQVTPEQIPVIESRPGFDVRPVLIDNQRVMYMNTVDPINEIMKDKTFRHALAHAVDRQLIVDSLWAGHTVPGTIGLFAGHGDYFIEDREPFPYDPDRARELLARTAYAGEELVFHISPGYVNYPEAGQMMQEMWREVGINVRIEIKATGIRQEPWDMVSHSNGMQMSDPLFTIWGWLGPETAQGQDDGPGRYLQVWEPTERYLELGRVLSTSFDFDERMAAFEAIIDETEDQMFALPVFQAVDFYGVRSDIEWKPYSFWPMDFGPRNLKFN